MGKDILKLPFRKVWEMYLQEYFNFGKKFKIKKGWKPRSFTSESYTCKNFLIG